VRYDVPGAGGAMERGPGCGVIVVVVVVIVVVIIVVLVVIIGRR